MPCDSVFLLNCAVQKYAWGKLGSSSEVARLCSSGMSGFKVEEGTPYAELWMGTHSKAPSTIVNAEESLSDWLKRNPSCKGEKVNATYPIEGQLPYLFKVLSVNKSLSIQAHPTKSHAEMLHQEKPDKYPDSNHKPEMAIALTKFEGMCGFRPKAEIVSFMKAISELRNIVGEAACSEYEAAAPGEASNKALQTCFTALMSCDESRVQTELSSLVNKVNSAVTNKEDTSSLEGELLLRLNGQFPGDVGCFCIYFLNHMWLDPGQAMFLEANLPHAYLSGDCIECMACSDNVVRAGLTPKFKDVPTLCQMLNYSQKSAKENLFPSCLHPEDDCVSVYDPPVPDFTVAKIQVPGDQGEYTVGAVNSASILLVIRGEAEATIARGTLKIQSGSVVFIAAAQTLKLTILSDQSLLMFRAYC